MVQIKNRLAVSHCHDLNTVRTVIIVLATLFAAFEVLFLAFFGSSVSDTVRLLLGIGTVSNVVVAFIELAMIQRIQPNLTFPHEEGWYPDFKDHWVLFTVAIAAFVIPFLTLLWP